MTFDGSGNALVVWAQDDSFRFNAWANGFVVGSGWGTPQLIESSDDVRQAIQMSLQATDDLRDGGNSETVLDGASLVMGSEHG